MAHTPVSGDPVAAESFDAVLAEMREWAARYESNGRAALATNLREYADRLQSAHEAEVAERDEEIRVLHILNAAQAVAITDNADDATLAESRADRAVGLLRECQPYVSSTAQASHLTDGFSPKPANAHDELAARLTAFLSEQAGERENGDG